uniref:Uncharacterized protein n=1 Tax=Plectus sambesii TaxID=2011161 RepID=A0A914VLR7_9BILA
MWRLIVETSPGEETPTSETAEFKRHPTPAVEAKSRAAPPRVNRARTSTRRPIARRRRLECRRSDACGPAPRIGRRSVNATVNDALIASSPAWSTERRDRARRGGVSPGSPVPYGQSDLTLALVADVLSSLPPLLATTPNERAAAVTASAS